MRNELTESEKKIIKSSHLVKDRLGTPFNAFVVYTRSMKDNIKNINKWDCVY